MSTKLLSVIVLSMSIINSQYSPYIDVQYPALHRILETLNSESQVPRALRHFIGSYKLENMKTIDIVVRYKNSESWRHKFDFLDDFLPNFNTYSLRLDIQTKRTSQMEISEPRSYYVLLLDDVFMFDSIIRQLSSTKVDQVGKFFVYFLGSTPSFANDFDTVDIIFRKALEVNVVDIVVLARRTISYQERGEYVEVFTYFPFNDWCNDIWGTTLGYYYPGNSSYRREVNGSELFQMKYNYRARCTVRIGVTPHEVMFHS